MCAQLAQFSARGEFEKLSLELTKLLFIPSQTLCKCKVSIIFWERIQLFNTTFESSSIRALGPLLILVLEVAGWPRLLISSTLLSRSCRV